MPEGDARPGRGIILIADTSDERCESLCCAVRAVGLNVWQVGDVYLGLGEILARVSVPPAAVVVKADNLDASEIEFFSLAGRLVGGEHVHVLGGPAVDGGLIRSAIAASATVLETGDLVEWAQSLAEPVASEQIPDAAPVPTCQERVEAADAMPKDDSLRESAELAPEPAVPAECDVSPEPAPPAQGPSGASIHPDAEASGEPHTGIQDEQSPDSAVEPESSPSAVPVARPIEVPGPWGHDVPNGGAGASEADNGGPAASFPWRPSPDRPTRTPPSARAIEHPPLRGPTEVELTREELDALLDDRTTPPDSWRTRR